jgi:hypothetical protein
MAALPLFHLAFPVTSLEQARAFYGSLLGCREGRSAPDWVDFDFYGHQIVAHVAPGEAGHSGAILPLDEWEKLAAKLKAAGQKFIVEPHVRFEGEVGEQATMFLLDPCGNALEFKAFKDIGRLFAK